MSRALQDGIQNLAASVERRLEFHFSNYRHAPSVDFFESRVESEIFDEVESLTMRGGKRLRAVLVLIGGGLFDDSAFDNSAYLDAATALELIQTYLLVHDDIMDNDSIRRGGPSVHVSLENSGHPRDEAIGLAILAGDLAKALAEEIIAALRVEAGRLALAQKMLANMHRDVIYGQYLDVTQGANAETIARHKTASYTTIGPLLIGAALSGASLVDLEELFEIATSLGIAFQIKDDLLGLFGDPDQLGKPIGVDLRAGKRNWVIERALELAGPDEKGSILATHGRIGSSEDAVQGALEIIKASGAPDDAKHRIDELIDQAVRRTDRSQYREKAADLLKKLARYVSERTS